MTAFGVIIFSLLLSLGFREEQLQSVTGTLTLGFWSLFTLFSFFYTLNGILLKISFDKAVSRYRKEGKPVQGVRGYNDLVSSLNGARNLSIAITVGSIFSFSLYIVKYLGLTEVKNLTTLAIAFAFIVISVIFLVEYPEETSFSPGGLIGFYEPDVFPLTLDNLLSDVFLTYLDPATYMDIDEWLAELESFLPEEFEKGEKQETRVERAMERILLISYLSQSLPEMVTPEIEKKEIMEVVGRQNYDAFVKGKKTGLTYKEIKNIVRKVENQAEEVFRLVDQLVIKLMDDYKSFRKKEMYFDVMGKTQQGSIKESTGLLVFVLNMKGEENSRVTVKTNSDINNVQPHAQQVVMPLDRLTFELPEDPPKFVSDGEDVLSILTALLQTGDTVWFRFKPNSFGYKVVTVQIENEEGQLLFGNSLEMKFTKSLSFYVKAYLPKLSALGGVALPVIQGFFGF